MASLQAQRAKMLALGNQQAELENQIMTITQDLNSPSLGAGTPVGLHGNLLDAEGFPRADIDIYAVRGMRNQLARLQNDHQAVMKQIETGLVDLHAAQRAAKALEQIGGGGSEAAPAPGSLATRPPARPPARRRLPAAVG